jgi:hypothetical protein
MKKIAIITLLSIAGICSYAQNAYDALLFSENDYEGTARTMAMGNAFTALGGDIGSIGLNPAGSAVAKYSQISFTPAFSISASKTQGVSPYEDGYLPYFENTNKSSMTRFGMPSFGLSFNWDTNRQTGLKNMSFGFIVNRTATYDEDVYASGTNSTTSFMGALAYDASINGYLADDLNAEDAYDFMPWKPVVGYQSKMISTFGDYNDQYVGASELIFDNEDISVGGPLNQYSGRRVTGNKYDYLINVSANISDLVYIGANLGITSIEYDYKEYFIEEAMDPNDFEITLSSGEAMYFDNMQYKNSYSASGNGFYGKFGVLVTPGSGLRIGAAIQTPTVNNITEYWQQAGETNFTDSRYNGFASSPEGRGGYTMVSPFRFNAGLAYALGNFGVVSADYEICNYGQMRYKSTNFSDREYFEGINEDIRSRFGNSHMLRIGAEVKPISEMALRVGYGLKTSAEKYNVWGEELDPEKTQNLSFGIGYSSKKSFFADLAARRTFLPDEYFMPYEDYIFDADGNVDPNFFAPEILNERSMWKILLTLGWRF